MKEQELNKILEKHKKWLNNEPDGVSANLRGADLSYADLSGTDLSGTNLSYADLSDADLSCANLSCTNLSCANLMYANLSDVIYNEATTFFKLQCPEEGSFIGFKKCNKYIVKLEITEDAKRSSATTRKCRCSKAKVLSITNIDGTECSLKKIPSNWDEDFIYEVGKTVEIKNFDEDRWKECTTGIHFFITRDEAVNY